MERRVSKERHEIWISIAEDMEAEGRTDPPATAQFALDLRDADKRIAELEQESKDNYEQGIKRGKLLARDGDK